MSDVLRFQATQRLKLADVIIGQDIIYVDRTGEMHVIETGTHLRLPEPDGPPTLKEQS